MKRRETGNMGRKRLIQFWKAQEGDILLALFIMQHRTNQVALRPGTGDPREREPQSRPQFCVSFRGHS